MAISLGSEWGPCLQPHHSLPLYPSFSTNKSDDVWSVWMNALLCREGRAGVFQLQPAIAEVTELLVHTGLLVPSRGLQEAEAL